MLPNAAGAFRCALAVAIAEAVRIAPVLDLATTLVARIIVTELPGGRVLADRAVRGADLRVPVDRRGRRDDARRTVPAAD